MTKNKEKYNGIKVKIKNLKIQYQKELDQSHKTQKEIDELKELKKEYCNHPKNKIKIRSQSYMEEGRMRAPSEWEEKVCRQCGKILATRSDESKKSKWQKQ